MGLRVYTLIAHDVGGYVNRAVFTLFVGVFVLRALFGNLQLARDDWVGVLSWSGPLGAVVLV